MKDSRPAMREDEFGLRELNSRVGIRRRVVLPLTADLLPVAVEHLRAVRHPHAVRPGEELPRPRAGEGVLELPHLLRRLELEEAVEVVVGEVDQRVEP